MSVQFEKFKLLCTDKTLKKKSFNLLTILVREQVKGLGISNLDSDKAVDRLQKITSMWSDAEFAFLLIHSCYIPDHYPETGSEETLFSKLVECLVCEWGSRLGYESILQRKKATKEDITFFRDSDVVVCDVKSSRLGRSQKSPNVKDVMKTSEYLTWINHYTDKNKVGGFATFPSLMEWSKGSTIHTYLTDKNNPIMLLHNEHLAYMLLKKNKNQNLIFDTLKNYPTFFPNKIADKNKAKKRYGQVVVQQLKTLEDESDFDEFLGLSGNLVKSYVDYSIDRLKKIIKKNVIDAESEVKNLSPEHLGKKYVQLKTESLNKEHGRVLANIIKFRT